MIALLKMTEKSRDFCAKYIPKVLAMSEINDALSILYDLIDEKGFAPPHFYDYNDFGREAQRVYDDLYLSNGGIARSALDDLKKPKEQ